MTRSSERPHVPDEDSSHLEGGGAWDEFLPESPEELQFLSESSEQLQGLAGSPHVHDYSISADAPSVPTVESVVATGSILASPGHPVREPEIAAPSLEERQASPAQASAGDDLSETVSLDEVIGRQVPVQWAEAVATVEELCRVLIEEQSTGIPELADVRITSSGRLLVTGAAPRSGTLDRLGEALHSLLPASTTPLSLRLFVTSSALRYSSIKQYSEALAHYAATQASRTELIQALCRTALGIGSRPMAPARAKPEAFPQPVVLAKRRRLGRGVAVAAVVLLCLLGAAALLLPSFAVAPTPAARSSIVTPVEASPPEIPEPQPASRPETEAPGPATATAPARPAVAGASAAVRVPQYVPPPNAPPPAPDPSRETARGGQVASPLQALPVNAGSVATAKPPVAEPPPPARSSREPGAVAGDGPAAFVPPVATSGGARDPRIYTVNDRDVDPPVLLSPGLPTAPGLADRVSNILEVLVDEAGHVQSVKMQSTSRMTDTMVTSAAKYMKFRPASKNGKAVQYRLFMKVSSPPPR